MSVLIIISFLLNRTQKQYREKIICFGKKQGRKKNLNIVGGKKKNLDEYTPLRGRDRNREKG